MMPKGIKFIFSLCLIFLSSAQFLYASNISNPISSTDPIYVENSHTDDFQIEKLILVPLETENHFTTGLENDLETFDLTESEEEVETDELFVLDSSDSEQKYFIAQFFSLSKSEFSQSVKAIGLTYSFLKIASSPRFVLFQDFRI